MATDRMNIQATVRVDHRLEFMVKLQAEFQTFLHQNTHPAHLDPVAKMDYVRTQALGLITEVNEALNETGWKPWATSNHINRDAYVSELVDVWHFLMNMMIAVEMTPDELFQGYVTKQAINRKRQQDKYDGVSTKCPGCRRAYDDKAVTCTPRTNTEPLSEATPAWCGQSNQYLSPTGDVLTPGPTGWYVA